MGRLWQTVILVKEKPVFEYLPIETEIKSSQGTYYSALSESDKEGNNRNTKYKFRESSRD